MGWDAAWLVLGCNEAALFRARKERWSPTESDDKFYGEDRPQKKGESQGYVIFHDAMMIPDKASERPFVRDVLTVHHKEYYDKSGKSWPNDYEDPVPVSFLTVKPGVRFLFALSGPQPLTRLASQLLHQALAEWGIGGKTSLGYGCFKDIKEVISRDLAQKLLDEQKRKEEAAAAAAQAEEAREEALEGELYNRFSEWLINNPEELGKTKQLKVIMAEWLDEILAGNEQERELLWQLISGHISKNKKTKDGLQELKEKLTS